MDNEHEEAPSRRPRIFASRVPYWFMGGVAALLLAFMLYKGISGGGRAGKADIAALGRSVEAVNPAEALGGDSSTPDLLARIEKKDTEDAENALRSGDSHFPVITPEKTPPSVAPVTQGPPQVPMIPQPTPRPEPAPVISTGPRQIAPVGVGAETTNLLEAMRAVQNGMHLPGAATAANKVTRSSKSAKADTKEPEAAQDTAAQAKATSNILALLAPGAVLYCLNQYEVDSDNPATDVVFRVLHPLALDGAQVFGSWKRQDENLVIELRRFTFQGQEIALRGLAINPEDAKANVASDVDTHFLERWGGLLASSFIQGLGEALVRSKTRSSTTGDTTTVSSADYSVGDIVIDGAGKVGAKASAQFEKNFNRPPTVRLHPGAEVAVVIIESNAR